MLPKRIVPDVKVKTKMAGGARAPGLGGSVKTLKVIVDYELCEANALCLEAAPEVFELDGDDKLHLLQEQPAESLRNKIEKAVRLCPKGALSLERVS
jgi:ferredoxin